MYSLINWKNHVVEYPLRRTITDNRDGTYNVEPSPGEILQKGTKQSAENFNHMDSGILDAHLASQAILQKLIHESVDGAFSKDEDGSLLIPGYVKEKDVKEASYEDIQELVGEVWDAPYEPPRPEDATNEDIDKMFD